MVRSATIETSLDAQFPNISGDNDKVYIVYKLGSNLKLKKSTNAGQNWSSLNNQDVGNNTCNGIDIVYDGDGLHVVYAMQDNGSDYETYYRLISNDQWGSIEYVTGYGTEVGGFPTVALSTNRVHVGYNTDNETNPWASLGTAKTRDKIEGSGWQTPQTVATGSESSSREKVQVAGNYLYDFFFDQWEYGFAVMVKSRTLSGNQWSSATQINAHCDPIQYMGAEQTNNGYLHVIYGDYDLLHNYYNGSSWVSEIYLSSITDGEVNTPLSSESNDLYAVWKDYNSSYLKYCQWDDYPLAPQSLVPGDHQQGGESYAKITWQLNNEPDVYIKQDAFEIWRRIKLWNNPWGAWGVVDYKNGDETEFWDREIVGAFQAEVYTAEYKIRARDMNNNYSPYSNVVTIEFRELGKKSASRINFDYNLGQNYPNPFNPITQIDYSIKSAGMVTLKVYDLLGTEVASLVNERQEAGNYSVTFVASDIPSGIYVYKLVAGSFVETKKLILLK